MSGKVSGSSSSNLGGLDHRSGTCRENRWKSSWCCWDVRSSHAESVDVIRDVVDSLHKAVRVHVLVGTASHAKSVLCLSFGRVDVLVAEAELTELILSVELAGWSLDRDRDWSWGKRERLGCKRGSSWERVDEGGSSWEGGDHRCSSWEGMDQGLRS